MFYSSEIKLAAYDLQQTWKTLQNLLAKKPPERIQVKKNLLVDERIIINDPKIIINNFDDYLINIGTKLAQTHEETDCNTISKSIFKRVGSFMYLDPTSPIKIFNTINALGSEKAVGCNEIL